jgi:hypothetical protein
MYRQPQLLPRRGNPRARQCVISGQYKKVLKLVTRLLHLRKKLAIVFSKRQRKRIFLFLVSIFDMLLHNYDIAQVVLLWEAVLRIRIRSRIPIRRMHMFLAVPNPDLDPLLRGTDPDPDPSIIKKNSMKNIDSYGSTVLWLLYEFLSLKNDLNVALKSNKQKNKMIFSCHLEGH